MKITNRTEWRGGKLNEVVTDGGAHLEHLGGNRWFLACYRADGSTFAVWFHGKISLIEEQPAPTSVTRSRRTE